MTNKELREKLRHLLREICSEYSKAGLSHTEIMGILEEMKLTFFISKIEAIKLSKEWKEATQFYKGQGQRRFQ